MPKTVLITGSSSLLGRALVNIFSADSEWKVVGLSYSRAESGNAKAIKCDLTDEAWVRSIFQEHQPHVVIHWYPSLSRPI